LKWLVRNQVVAEFCNGVLPKEDAYGLDLNHYRCEYVRREFLGELRCLVFDLDPLPKTGKGRFDAPAIKIEIVAD
jgi:hypothetical protein